MKKSNKRRSVLVVITAATCWLCLVAAPVLAQQLAFVPLAAKDANGGLWLEYDGDDSRDWFTRFNEPDSAPYRSTLALNQSVGRQMLHWGAARSDNQRLQQVGMSLGSVKVSGFSGSGDTISSIQHPWQAAGSFHFHGGLRHDYSFNGYRVDFSAGGQRSVGISRALISADRLEQREATELSFSGRRFAASAMQVSSAGELAGRAWTLSANSGNHRISLQQMQSLNAASYSALAISTVTDSGKTLAMRIERRRNALYQDANDDRIMVSLAFTPRSSIVMRAGEADADSDAQVKPKSNTVPILIGAGVVGGALALSSGGGNEADNRPRYNSQQAAAGQTLNVINPVSIQQNREFGGYVFRRADGTYSSTAPMRGGPFSVSLPSPFVVAPRGAQTTASYHTHAAFDPAYDNENFSPQDIRSDIEFGIDGYLGTPAGQFKFHDVSAERIVVLGGPGTLATN